MNMVQDDERRFLQPYEVEDEETRQMKCPHENVDSFMEDTGDSQRRFVEYRVNVCMECGLEWQT